MSGVRGRIKEVGKKAWSRGQRAEAELMEVGSVLNSEVGMRKWEFYEVGIRNGEVGNK